MSKILAVFGATGQQGGSVVNFVLNDAELSQTYRIRAITRDAASDKAARLRALGGNVEVVQADMRDAASVAAALAGAHTVFVVTIPSFAPDGFADELEQAKTVADAAVAQGVAYLILSTLPAVREISRGRYARDAFDAKAAAERYIRGLPVRSAFFSPGGFMADWPTFLNPRPAGSDTDAAFVIAAHTPSTARLPLVDAASDTGKCVGAILANPDRYEGKTFCGAAALYTWDEVADALSKASGKKVVYQQVSLDEFKRRLSSDPRWPIDLAQVLADMFGYSAEFGNWGPDSDELVAWTAANARGKLVTFEEYLKVHPPQFM